MKFVSINSDELKEALLEGNRISIQKRTYREVRYAVDNPSVVEEHFKYDNDNEKMFFGHINNDKNEEYIFLLMQYIYSSNTETCLDNLINLITNLTIEIQQKGLKIKTLESEIESIITEQTLDEIEENEEFDDSLVKFDNDIETTKNQVKLPSQKSYISVDNFNIFG